MTSFEPKGRGFFLGQRRDQLGARLLMILTSIRLGQDYNADFRFNWFPPAAEAPTLSNPGELFSSAFMDHHFITNEEMDEIEDDVEPIWKFLKDATPDALNRHLDAGGHVMLDEGFDIVTFPWEDKDALRKRFPAFIHQIEFTPLVTERIAEIDTALTGDGGSVAYHIRRGDILNSDPWMHKQWPSKIEPDELYSIHLRKENPDVALVFSDQQESIRRFQKTHPAVKSVEEIVDLSDCTIAQRDLLELYAMSRTTKIVAPPISAFSRAAALVSGRERLRFVDELDSPERDAGYEDLLERLKDGADNFVTPSEAAHLYAKLSARLPVQDREQDAYDIGKIVKDSGAPNAFVPLLHAVNCVYLNKWDEANDNIRQALNNPHLWQESHAAATAIHALILGALGKSIRCHRTFLRAFWQKPFLPDITVIGSFMINRRRMKPNHPLPFSESVVKAYRTRYQRSNMFLVQNKFVKRRAFDFSTLVVEWPYFVMDGKAERVVESRHALKAIYEKVMSVEDDESFVERDSYGALLQARMGDPDGALMRHSAHIQAEPDHIMIRKRQAEILAMNDRPLDAANIILPNAEQAQKQPYWHYLYGRFLLQAKQHDAARAAWETAAAMDMTTALIHSDLADLLYDMGDINAAAHALDRAAEIAPTKQKFMNRKMRYLKKIK